ncbi:zinc ribbon domain-containing protein [Pectinatus cerevisiiphilus]|uniref:Zinc ribbon protein n=1 Tax=Pectinatus cerevisiiphilus TaxID=86956 RepID=A0A4R3KEB0_9FIRM|nr:zinc ribbon domain-containing protein [Pectinatus cerevisiiphilus]TCS81413.1 zinc ribbon protein [Pectinatus cerevisiiphilus]
MNKYCRNCGAKLLDSSKFCPKCGIVVDNNTIVSQHTCLKTGMSDKERMTVIVTGVVSILAIIGIAAGIFWYKKTGASISTPQPVVAEQATGTQSTPASQPKTQESPPEENILDATQRLLSGALKPEQKVIASTLGHNENGFLALVNDSHGNYKFIIYDKNNDRIAKVYFLMKTYNFYIQKSYNTFDPLICLLEIDDDVHDNDEGLGIWNGSKHTFPIYAIFKVDQLGNVIPGMLYSGYGLKPGHYHEVLKEQKNVDMANLLLTEMKTLHQYIDEHNVSIPASN